MTLMSSTTFIHTQASFTLFLPASFKDKASTCLRKRVTQFCFWWAFLTQNFPQGQLRVSEPWCFSIHFLVLCNKVLPTVPHETAEMLVPSYIYRTHARTHTHKHTHCKPNVRFIKPSDTVPQCHDGRDCVIHLILSVQGNANEKNKRGKIKNTGGKRNTETNRN